MTSNQIADRKAREEARSNKEKERLEGSKQSETRRSNKVKEGLERRGQNLKLSGDLFKSASGLVGGLSKMANDPSWYGLDAELMRQVAALPFGKPLGIALPKVDAYESNITGNESDESVPGLMILPFAPTIGGLADAENDPINIAAKAIYAYVRHVNAGHTNYEAVDLMRYLYAMDSAYYMFAELCRLYSLLNDTKSENWYYTKHIVQALGYNYANLSQNIAQLRYEINQFARKLSAFNVPNVMPYYIRHTWMCSTLFKDSPIKKSQLYIFQPYGYFVNDDTKCYLDFTTWGKSPSGYGDHNDISTGGYTMTNIRSMINYIYTGLINSEDAGIISGDILKAYSDGQLFHLDAIPEDFHIEATFNTEVLTQIQSATVLPTVAPQSLRIYDKGDGILRQGFIWTDSSGNPVGGSLCPALYVAGYAGFNIANFQTIAADISGSLGMPKIKQWVLAMDHDDPTPGDTMVSTRLMAAMEVLPSGIRDWGTTSYPSHVDEMPSISLCGSEIITSAFVVKLTKPKGWTSAILEARMWSSVPYIYVNTLADATEASYANVSIYQLLTWEAETEAFDYHPIYYVLSLTKDTSSLHSPGILGDDVPRNIDYNNYVTLDSNELRALHAVALLSEFGIPIIMKGTTVKK